MKVAMDTAELSHATNLKVGAVAASDKWLVAHGYNGTPPGEDNNCEDRIYLKKTVETRILIGRRIYYDPSRDSIFYLKTKPNVIHAEDNLIRFASKRNIDLKGSTLYTTHSPCMNCAELIVKTGITRVVTNEECNRNDGSDILFASGIRFEHFSRMREHK